MFAKIAILSSIAVLVAANPPVTTTVTVTAPSTETGAATSCSPGPVQCCNSSTMSSSSFLGSFILALLGIDISLPNIPINFDCSPLSVIGVPSASCNGEAVCCENNDFDGLVVIGCSPVNIFL